MLSAGPRAARAAGGFRASARTFSARRSASPSPPSGPGADSSTVTTQSEHAMSRMTHRSHSISMFPPGILRASSPAKHYGRRQCRQFRHGSRAAALPGITAKRRRRACRRNVGGPFYGCLVLTRDTSAESLMKQLWRNRRPSAAPSPFDQVDFAIVDLETTGWAPEEAMITEIGAVLVCGGRVRAQFSSLVNPGGAIPEQVAVLTGIS